MTSEWFMSWIEYLIEVLNEYDSQKPHLQENIQIQIWNNS